MSKVDILAMKLSLKKQIEHKVAEYAKKLRITGYKFTVNLKGKRSKDPDFVDDNIYAMVTTDEETREVILDVNKTLLEKKPEEVEATVIHELLHVRLNELLNFINLITSKYINDTKARETYEKQIELLEHKIVVSITEALKQNGK
jgi:hypothetical protein